MSLLKEIWVTDIESNLFASNQFMNIVGRDDSAYVSYKTVHIPQAGSVPNTVANRIQLPAPVSQRTDTELTYNLNEFSTDPVVLTNIEELQISYNKRMDVIGDHIKQVGLIAANTTLYSWAANGSSRIIPTSGVSGALSLAPSATGTRKAFKMADLANAMSIIGTDNYDPQEDTYMIVPAAMYWAEMVLDTNISKFLEFNGKTSTAETGVVNMLMGVKILIRSSVVVYDVTNAIKPTLNGSPTTPAAGDNQGIIVCKKSAVRRALGQTLVFSNSGDGNGLPEYYGSLFSAKVMQGATKARADQRGIVSIVQAP